MMQPTTIFAALTTLLILAAGSTGCFDRAASGEWSNPDLPDAPPNWNVGAWWRYAGSNGITYTHTYEGTETKEGQASYRFQIALSETDEHGTSTYTYWYSVENLGRVAADQAPIYAKYDCPSGRWFPLDQSIEDDCGHTWYYRGAFFERYEASTVKVPWGWENVSLPAGDFPAFKFEFRRPESNGTFASFWYAPTVGFLVKFIHDNGIEYRLAAWGTGKAVSA